VLQKPQKTNLVFSSLEGESIPFSIGDSSVIIDIIRKRIYSTPLQTLVGEYLCNARDACIEAGKDSSNIEVTLPTQLAPAFTVRDYGVGMSDERVKEVFVRYGISTKRASNSQLGYFGIGAKSAWSYTDSFIVESFYGGIHRQYVADIGQEQEGRLILYSESPTEQTNGVLIKIPVNPDDVPAFQMAYTRATFLWEKRPKVNKELNYPEIVYSLGLVTIYKEHPILKKGAYVDAGGIPYPLLPQDQQFCEFCHNNNLFLVIKANPAKMSISANREGYSNTDYAKKLTEKAREFLRNYVATEFENTPPQANIALFQKMGALTSFRSTGDKGYALTKKAVYLTDGFFFLLQYKITYTKAIKKDLPYTSFGEVFLSKAKGAYAALPPLTKKALIALKGQYLKHSTTWVFFQNELTDENYLEIAGILEATKYIEDIFSELSVTKRVARAKIDYSLPENLPVWLAKPKPHYPKPCGKRVLTSVAEVNTEGYDTVFYGSVCFGSFYRFIKKLPIKYTAVIVDRQDILEKIDSLKLPNWVRNSAAAGHIRQNKEIGKWLNSIRSMVRHEVLCSLFEKLGLNIIAPEFNIESLLDKIKAFSSSKGSFHINDIQNYFDTSEFEKDDLDKFAEKYPLLTEMTRYSTFSQRVIDDMNLYIKAVDARDSLAAHKRKEKNAREITNCNADLDAGERSGSAECY